MDASETSTSSIPSDIVEEQNATTTSPPTISSLPFELLALVFTKLMSRSPEYQFSPENICAFEDTSFKPFDMAVRSVCRLWLHVADNTPALWARLLLDRPVVDFDGLSVILQRSGSAPLDLIITLSAASERLFSILQPEFVRVRSFQLNFGSWSLPWPDEMSEDAFDALVLSRMKLLQQYITLPAPLLEIFDTNGSIPVDAFSHVTPARLRCLSLQSCYAVSPASCIFKGTELTALDLNSCAVWESLDGLISFLSTLPKLRHLRGISELYEPEPPFARPNRFGRRSVRLPDLEYMELCLPLGMLARLIPVVDFPHRTKLALEGWFAEEPDASTPRYMLSMDTIQSSLDPHFKSLFPDISTGYDGMQISRYSRLHERGFDMRMDRSESSPAVPDFIFGVSWKDARHEGCAEIMLHLLRWHGFGATVRVLMAETSRLVAILFRALCANAIPSTSFVPALEDIYLEYADAETSALVVKTLDRRVEAHLPRLSLYLENCEIETPAFEILSQHAGVESARMTRNSEDDDSGTETDMGAAPETEHQATLEEES